MNKLIIAAISTAVLTVGTASASSLGLTSPDTVFSADTVVLSSCTVDRVDLVPDLTNVTWQATTPGSSASTGSIINLLSLQFGTIACPDATVVAAVIHHADGAQHVREFAPPASDTQVLVDWGAVTPFRVEDVTGVDIVFGRVSVLP